MFLKKRIYKYLLKKFGDIQNGIDLSIPKVDLAERHIVNAKLLTDRNRLLDFLPKGGVIAELGVNKGEFSSEIFKKCQPKVLHLVDVWGSERYHSGLRTIVETKFAEDIAGGRVHIHQGHSTYIAEFFPDEIFDWIYIDTDHSYVVTKAELHAYKSKIKSGGIIAGHDYIQGNWRRILRYGVMEAVHEFCAEEDWEVVFLTTEMKSNPSFAIRKILSNV